jgi:hypothetical protein
MNVVSSTRTEVDYTFKMSQSDLDRYLADPWAWRDETQAQLGGSLVGRVGGDGAAPAKRAKPGARSQITIGRSKKGAAAKNGHARQNSGPNQKIPCERCPRLIARSRMARHMVTKHGAPAPSGNGLHPEAAPAAA